MRMYDIIDKKKRAASLTDDEINFAVESFVDGKTTLIVAPIVAD